MTVRILLVDDHGVVRAGLRSLLTCEADFQVVGEAGDGDAALRLASQLRPDIILMDISMPGAGGNGIEVTRKLREVDCNLRVLVLTMHEDKGMLREAIRAGAAGYVLKRAMEGDLIQAIRTVAGGEMYIQSQMVHALITEPMLQPAGRKLDEEALSSREVEVLRLICQGYTNHEMADELSLSVRTVESHRANLMGKLNVRSRVDLVRYARTRGLVN
jgi:two-component system, NarL family, response regulator NreC